MSLWNHHEFNEHERVTFYHDKTSGLRAIHAMHRLVNGRCGGGIRFYPYQSTDAALTDVLRLSRAMTYKMVLAGLAIGGGKTVIIGDPSKDKSAEKLTALGHFIHSFQGQYIGGPDVGTTSEDMVQLAKITPHVAGHSGGSTAVPTAYGVFKGIQAAVKHKFDRDDLVGISVAVQGVGGVGELLCHHLHEAGAKLFIADMNETAVAKVTQATNATVVHVDEILFQDVDVLAPCALGAVLNDDTIPSLQTQIICGGANNQMAETRHNQLVQDRGILFAPDYVVNAGGVLGGTAELGILSADKYESRLDGIYDTTLQLFKMAAEQKQTPEEAAVQLAEARLDKQ